MSVSEVMIKKWGEPSAEWKKLTGVSGDEITVTTRDWSSFYDMMRSTGSLSFTLKVTGRSFIRLRQTLGFLKKPKCTYRTIRRDCAKRNRR